MAISRDSVDLKEQLDSKRMQTPSSKLTRPTPKETYKAVQPERYRSITNPK